MLEDNFDRNFKPWVPGQGLDQVYDLEFAGFVRDQGFVAVLIPDHFEREKRSNHKLRLAWDNVISYIVTDESYRPELWASESQVACMWSFYISETSDYLSKFRDRNYIVPEKTYHFLLAGTNLMLDLISPDFPKVSFMEGD